MIIVSSLPVNSTIVSAPSTVKLSLLGSQNAILRMPPKKGMAIRNEGERSETSITLRYAEHIPFHVGARDRTCLHCGAYRWALERTAQNQRIDRDVYSNCCQQGDVTLPMSDFDGPLIPDDLKQLFAGGTPGALQIIRPVKMLPYFPLSSEKTWQIDPLQILTTSCQTSRCTITRFLLHP